MFGVILYVTFYIIFCVFIYSFFWFHLRFVDEVLDNQKEFLEDKIDHFVPVI